MQQLSDRFLETLVEELADDNTVALGLFGSYSRGTATKDSDVDLTRFVEIMPAYPDDRRALLCRHGHLVSVLTTRLTQVAEQLTQPEQAIWTVSTLRNARILVDKSGGLTELQQRARRFRWEPLQSAAAEWASRRLMKFAEETHKLISALRAHDDVKVMTETIWLILGLPIVVAVQRGILLTNETAAPQEVQEVVGIESAWSRFYRAAAGLSQGPPASTPAQSRGLAALCLYHETARLLDKILHPQHRVVVEFVLASLGTS